ncbi:MAG: hypothetical protein EXS35_11525 [Pedosphaera sp.]|nr:hypothetical protein [Pedosphaera sp.]
MKIVRLFACALILFLSLTKLSATLMTPLPVEELTQRANLILHATVTSKVCERTAEGRIITRVELDVSEVLKGNLTTNHFTVVHGGGTVGNIRTEVSGQVEYTVGEEVVAFLVLNPRGEGVTLGLAQGKFHVWKDKQSGEKFAHNIFHGATEQETAQDEKKAAKLALKELAHAAKGGAK